MLINLSKYESNLRVVSATILLYIGTHILGPLLIPLGLFLLYTGLTYKCPLTYLLNIHTQSAQDNLFVHFLLRYNPQPVFIFKADNQLAFSNQPAQNTFSEITHFYDLIDRSIVTIQRVIGDYNDF